MGYKVELPRSLSFFSVLGLSFAVMTVSVGESVTLSIGLTNGGPVTITGPQCWQTRSGHLQLLGPPDG